VFFYINICCFSFIELSLDNYAPAQPQIQHFSTAVGNLTSNLDVACPMPIRGNFDNRYLPVNKKVQFMPTR